MRHRRAGTPLQWQHRGVVGKMMSTTCSHAPRDCGLLSSHRSFGCASLTAPFLGTSSYEILSRVGLWQVAEQAPANSGQSSGASSRDLWRVKTPGGLLHPAGYGICAPRPRSIGCQGRETLFQVCTNVPFKVARAFAGLLSRESIAATECVAASPCRHCHRDLASVREICSSQEPPENTVQLAPQETGCLTWILSSRTTILGTDSFQRLFHCSLIAKIVSRISRLNR